MPQRSRGKPITRRVSEAEAYRQMCEYDRGFPEGLTGHSYQHLRKPGRRRWKRMSEGEDALSISPEAEQRVRKAMESYRLFQQLTHGMDDQGRRAILRRFYLCVLLRNGSKDKEVLTEKRTGQDARTLKNFSVRTLNYMEDLYLFGKAVGLNREALAALIALSSFMDSYQIRVKELPEEVTVHAEWRDEWLSATLYLLVQFTKARTGTKHYDILARMLTDTAEALGMAKTYTGDFIRQRATRYGTVVSGFQAWWNTLYPPSRR